MITKAPHPKTSLSSLMACVLLLGGVVPAVSQIPAGKDGFHKNVRPFLQEHCFRCHGPDEAKGKLTLHKLTGVGGSDEEMETWEDILIMIEDGDMPPDAHPCRWSDLLP